MTQEKAIEIIIDEIFDNCHWLFNFDYGNSPRFYMYYKKIRIAEYYPEPTPFGEGDFFELAYSEYILCAAGFDVRKINYHENEHLNITTGIFVKRKAVIIDPYCQEIPVVNGYLSSEIYHHVNSCNDAN